MTLPGHSKAKLVTAISMVLGGASLSAQANLTSSASLSFDPGTPILVGCAGGNFTGTSCTFNGTPVAGLEITDMGGSYFALDQGGSPGPDPFEKTAISQFAPLNLGATQTSSGQHTGTINGSENPAIDNPWNFAATAGMHTLTSPISVISDFGSTKTLDFSGWGANWGSLGPGGTQPTIALSGVATIVCSTSSCSAGSTYTLDMNAHVPAAFPSVPYSLHLEGTVNAPVPIPAAAWLFGSGVLGLGAIAKRRKRI